MRRGPLIAPLLLVAGLLAPAASAVAAPAIPLDLHDYRDSWTTFAGEVYDRSSVPWTTDKAGASVAGGCDLDDDGVPDAIVGAPSASAGGLDNAGRISIVRGGAGAAGTYALAERAAVAIEGDAANHRLGTVVACTGDVDGDGVDDLAIGVAASSAIARRAAYVVFGGAGLFATRTLSVGALGSQGFKISGGGGTAGTFVAGVGDLNGDGRAEVAVGNGAQAFGSASSAGVVTIVLGKADATAVNVSTDTAARLMRIGGQTGDKIERVAAVGDVDGDGTGDLLVGAPGEDDGPQGADAGAAYLVSGSATGDVDVTSWATSDAILFPIWGPAAGAQAGGTVAAAGDADGDGRPDVALGAAANASLTGAGGATRRDVWVVRGSSAGDPVALAAPGARGHAIRGIAFAAASDELGRALAPVGDLDGDGRDDLAIGAESFAGPAGEATGALFLVYGRTAAEGDVELAGLTCADGARTWSEEELTGLGSSVAAAGRFDGSATPRLLVGAGRLAGSNAGFARAIPLAARPGACGSEPEPPAPVVEVDWGFRENFRGYVTRGFDPAAPAVPISASRGATCDVNPDPVRGGCDPRLRLLPADPPPARALRWTPVGASATDGGDATVATIGTVTFRYPGHFFTLAVEDPWFTVADGHVTVRARVDLDVAQGFGGASSADARVTLGRFPLDGGPVVTAQHVVWRTEAGTLADEAAGALGGFLGRGSLLDPVTITIPHSLGPLPEEPGVPRPPEEPRPGPDPAPGPRPQPQPQPPLPRARAPARAVATIAPAARRVVVRRAGRVAVATVRCRVARCRVAVPKSVRVRFAAAGVRARVVAPARLASGRRGIVRVVVGKALARSLASRGATVRVPIVVRGAGRPVSRTVAVTLRGAARR